MSDLQQLLDQASDIIAVATLSADADDLKRYLDAVERFYNDATDRIDRRARRIEAEDGR